MSASGCNQRPAPTAQLPSDGHGWAHPSERLGRGRVSWLQDVTSGPLPRPSFPPTGVGGLIPVRGWAELGLAGFGIQRLWEIFLGSRVLSCFKSGIHPMGGQGTTLETLWGGWSVTGVERPAAISMLNSSLFFPGISLGRSHSFD